MEKDEAKQAAIKQKTELDNYLYSVSKTLKKSDVKRNIPKDIADNLLDEIEEIIEWVEDNPDEEADVYEKKMRDFEIKAELILYPFRVFEGKRFFHSVMRSR